MATTTNFSVRMDSDIKKQCEALYGELGINLTTAINVFLRQSLRVGGFPFDVRMEQPNKETMAAMLEAERIARDPSVKRYSDVEEALRAVTCSHHLNLTILKWGLPARLPFKAKLKQAIPACPAVLFFIFIRLRIFSCAVRHILYRSFFLLLGY